jgi:hypothetical protein
MRTINLDQEKLNFDQLIRLARKEPLLILTADGGNYILSQADDFEQEVQLLRNSKSFQKFLDERSNCKVRIPLSEIENEIEQELLKQKRKA